MSGQEIREMTEGAWLNTDDNMSIEYRAPMNLHRSSTAEANVEMLLKYAMLPEVASLDPQRWLELSSHYLKRNDWDRSMEAAIEALGVLVKDDPDIRPVLVTAMRQHQDEKWVASVMTLLRVANGLLAREDVPPWFERKWELWRLETLRYLEGGEERDDEGAVLSPDRKKAVPEVRDRR